jgi:hypothetical protein
MRLVFDEHEKLSLWGKGETPRGRGDYSMHAQPGI